MGIKRVSWIFLFILAACHSDAKLAEVGRFSIRSSDVSYKNQVVHIYYPNEQGDLGLDLLIKAYTSAQILEQNGRMIGEDVIQHEAERIDRESLAPEMLAKLKAVFGSDRASYLRDFVLPNYAERIIYYDFFLTTPSIHEASRKVAEDFLVETSKKPSDFFKVAASRKLQRARLVVSPLHGMNFSPAEGAAPFPIPAPPGTNASPPSQSQTQMQQEASEGQKKEALLWIDQLLKPTARGRMVNKVVDFGDQWLIVRNLGPDAKDKTSYRTETVGLPKQNYQEWYDREAAKVKITRF